MDSEQDVRFRMRLAEGFLHEAHEDLHLSRWRSCVDNAQLSVENSVKAVIARFAPVPRTHDLAGPLQELHASADFGPEMKDLLWELRTCAEQLGYEEHVRSDYGEEGSFVTPWELFDQSDAQKAVEIARRALSLAKQVVQS
jgi:HEPN domain-containing protein